MRMHLLLVKSILSIIVCVTFVNCLYEDQKGKFDWRRRFIGVPKFVYHPSGSENLIVGTESNVVTSLHIEDGSIIWRQLLPDNCKLDHMSIINPGDDYRDSIIRTSCIDKDQNKLTQLWNPQNGLLVSQSRYEDIAENDSAESVLSDSGRLIEDNSLAFTLTDDLHLIVTEDSQVILRALGTNAWTREESLASIIAAEIVLLPDDMRDRFGLKKVITILCNNGKMFGIDTITGSIIWTQFDREMASKGFQSSATLVVSKQSKIDSNESRVIVVHPKGLLVYMNPITGAIIEKTSINPISQYVQTQITTQDDKRGIIVLDTQRKIHIYPVDLTAQIKENIHQYYMILVDKSKVSLQGIRLAIESDHIVPKDTWELPLNQSEVIVNLAIKRIDEEAHSPARVLGDRGILYKYLNPNVIAVMTQGNLADDCSPDSYINVYLIDGVTGSLVHSVSHPKSRSPARMIHSENWLVYSYYNTKSRRTEISSMEMFEGPSQSNSSAFSSLARASLKPKLIEHKSFIFPGGIDAMADTVTLNAMTNRHLIFALPSGALLEVPKIFLDPRRPINMLMEHREEGLIPYMPELPLPSESMINYDRTLTAIRKITTSPAMLESTSLVFAYGLDLFFTRVTPSKTFDILKDDFDHLLITGVLIFLTVASYVSKLLAQRKALRAAWK